MPAVVDVVSTTGGREHCCFGDAGDRQPTGGDGLIDRDPHVVSWT
jgi:hypothetical protein